MKQIRLIESLKNKVLKNRWSSFISGIFASVFGVWCLITSKDSLSIITYIFVFVFFVSGIFEVIFVITNRKKLEVWGWKLISGIFDIVLGILRFVLPVTIISRTFVYLLGIWIFFHSFLVAKESMTFRKNGAKHWGWIFFIACIGFIISVVFFISPIGLKQKFFINTVSVIFIIHGLYRIYQTFKFKSV